jgi:uncharacterized protein YcfJ
MKKALVISSVATAALMAALPASAMDIMARVISSTPVVQQVAVPRQVCNNQQYITEAPRSGGGALLGALVGGVAGNAIGSGGGRAAATALGVFGGAIAGDRIEGGGAQQVQNVQQCGTQTSYENRTTGYNVVYEYQGQQYNAQMANDPGLYVRLQVSPVGGVNTQPGQPQALQQQPQNQVQNQVPVEQGYVVQSSTQQPVYAQPSYAQPVYGQPVYVQPPIVYQSAPVYYGRPYYGPAFAPIGLSLNLGYSRGYGHRGHWR